MPLPLEGLLVISMDQAVAAPLCACRLADAGARVIKIERPEGDFARGYDSLAKGESAYFVWLNRGKESVVLDLTKAEDKALLERMLAKADVFIQNLKPGAVGEARLCDRAAAARLSEADLLSRSRASARAGLSRRANPTTCWCRRRAGLPRSRAAPRPRPASACR